MQNALLSGAQQNRAARLMLLGEAGNLADGAVLAPVELVQLHVVAMRVHSRGRRQMRLLRARVRVRASPRQTAITTGVEIRIGAVTCVPILDDGRAPKDLVLDLVVRVEVVAVVVDTITALVLSPAAAADRPAVSVVMVVVVVAVHVIQVLLERLLDAADERGTPRGAELRAAERHAVRQQFGLARRLLLLLVLLERQIPEHDSLLGSIVDAKHVHRTVRCARGDRVRVADEREALHASAHLPDVRRTRNQQAIRLACTSVPDLGGAVARARRKEQAIGRHGQPTDAVTMCVSAAAQHAAWLPLQGRSQTWQRLVASRVHAPQSAEMVVRHRHASSAICRASCRCGIEARMRIHQRRLADATRVRHVHR